MQNPKHTSTQLRKLLVILVVLVLLLGLVVSLFAGRYAKGELLAQLEHRFGGQASVEDFNLSLLGHFSLKGLEVRDPEGRAVLQVQELKAAATLRSLLSLYPELSAELNGFELTLRQELDGSWNYEGWSDAESNEQDAEGPGSGGREQAVDRLAFHGGLLVSAGRIVLVANNGTTRIEDLRAKGGVPKDQTRLSMEFTSLMRPSPLLRASGSLEESVGLRGDLQGDLARGPMGAEWDLNLGLTHGAGELVLSALVTPAVLLGQDPNARSETGLRLELDAKSLGLNAEVMPLLAMLHPIFQSLSGLDNAAIGGLLDGSVQLAFRGSIPPQEDLWTFMGSSMEAISGAGTVGIAHAALGDAPMLQEMLSLLGIQSNEVNLTPLKFEIKQGRVAYQEGWGWKLGGIPTSFSGSVGLDGSLDLAWNAPVTDALIAKHSFLKSMKGKSVGIPIRGSMQNPVFDFQGALESSGKALAQEMVQEIVQDELLDKLGLEEVPALEDLGKLGLDRLGLGAKSPGAEDPAAMLKEADALWDRGEKAGAALIYARIRSEHKTSLTYTLNRSRIKRRAEGQE